MSDQIFTNPRQTDCSWPERLLFDNLGRKIDYLRIAITDRCNLRCTYCMPEEGVCGESHDEILTFEELERLVALFCGMGVSKVRITGGEPFVRLGCVPFLRRLKKNIGVPHLHITTNGVATHNYLEELRELGVSGLNVSLDTLSRSRFIELTRRDRLECVIRTIDAAIRLHVPLKINSVVTNTTTDQEIRSLAYLTNHLPISVRFIEHMPFSGEKANPVAPAGKLSHRLKRLFPGHHPVLTQGTSTARLYKSEGSQGTIGIIEGESRKFCGQCNKVRVTPVGILKSCLYDEGVLDLKAMLRNGKNDTEIEWAIRRVLRERQENGRVAEHSNGLNKQPSMATIGG